MKLTKKLFIAIMTMALLVVTFSASTFAWFTLGQESEIEQIQVKVRAGKGMEVAQVGQELVWRNNLVLTDGTGNPATANNNGTGKEYLDVTSNDGLNFFKIEGGEYVAAEEADYLTFKFYVRVTVDENGDPDFDGIMLKSVTGNDAQFEDEQEAAYQDKWMSDATFSGEGKNFTEGTEYEFDSLNAVKMSFQSQEDAKPKFLFGYENVKEENSTRVNKNNGDVALDGIARAYADAKGYDVPDTFAEDKTTAPTYMKKADLDAALAEDATADELKSKVTVLVSDDFKEASDIFDAETAAKLDTENYLYAELTIRVWLEGWDADCINAILEQETYFSFELKAWKKTN